MWDELHQLNERLAVAADKAARERKLENRVAELEREQKEAAEQARRLKQQVALEEADVERLEKLSLTNLFHTVLGSKDHQLDKERQEALAAQLKSHEATRRSEALQRDLDQARKDLTAARGAGEPYAALLREKEALIDRSAGPAATELMRLGQREQELQWQTKELTEARAAGHRADAALAQVEESLQSAQGWGTWDMLGGGIIATAVKHSRMDDARSHAVAAQAELSAFQRELKDVAMAIDLGDIGIDGFSRFADYFFDGLIVDWVVQNRINESLNGVRGAHEQVRSLLRTVETRLQENQSQLGALHTEREAFIARYNG